MGNIISPILPGPSSGQIITSLNLGAAELPLGDVLVALVTTGFAACLAAVPLLAAVAAFLAVAAAAVFVVVVFLGAMVMG